MSPQREDPKAARLRAQGVFYAAVVSDPLFVRGGFFDPRDLVQVKYEMLRRVQAEGQAVTQTVAAFGCSRPAFYQAQRVFAQGGLPGLLPRKRGPRGGYKLTADLLAVVETWQAADPTLAMPGLAGRLREQFQVQIHPRTLARALRRQEKKRP